MRLQHIAVACKDIEKTRLLREHLLDTIFDPVKKVESQDVVVSFCNFGACPPIKLLQAAGSQFPRFPIMPQPEMGAEGLVVFLNPGDCGGTLVEICEVKSDGIG